MIDIAGISVATCRARHQIPPAALLSPPRGAWRCCELSGRYGIRGGTRCSTYVLTARRARERGGEKVRKRKRENLRAIARRMHARRDGKGRKATSTAETRRDTTRKDDEGRRGSRTAALNAVPSDRQHRLLRGSSARSGSSSLYARSSTATLAPPSLSLPLLLFSPFLFSSSHFLFSLSLLLFLDFSYIHFLFLSLSFSYSHYRRGAAAAAATTTKEKPSRRGWKTRAANLASRVSAAACVARRHI